jgi:predicted phosphodiesterase
MKIHSLLITLFAFTLSQRDLDAQEKPVAESLFRTAPYLQNATATGMTIAWSTTKPCYSWVEYGDTDKLGKKAHTVIDGQVIANNTVNKIRLSELAQGGTVHYKVCSREILNFGAYKVKWGRTETSKIHTFKTIAKNAEKVTCAIFNDLHDRHPLFHSLAKQIEAVDYDFSIFNGDCYNDPSKEDGVIKSLNVFNRGIKSVAKPVIYLRGNHEIRGAYSRQWSNHFDTPGSKQYYAITRGPVRFIFLDCGEDKVDTHGASSGLYDFSGFRKEQAEWLKQELKSDACKKASFRVLVHHIPLFGLKEGRANLWKEWLPIVNNAGIDMSIHGHTHRAKIHQPNTAGKHDFPVIIGGGNKPEGATVTILEATTKELKVKMVNGLGKTVGACDVQLKTVSR